ncbi:MAG: capsular polysaccharide synthesis protein [Paraprevotella sp.]|nr:capsular polysaccharide synthesis protein [Paraprevotella sp.]
MSGTKRFFKRIEKFFVTCKQRFIIHYLLSRAGGKALVEHYNRRHAPDDAPIRTDSPIWTCWWQGEKNMPDIVKACYNAMRRHAGKHPVILITADNYKDYVELPDYILEKQKAGLIDLTHFSDILRMVLLRTHGGIWMDSTLLIPSKNLDDFIRPEQTFWSCHHRPIYYNVSKGGWVSFFLACGKGHILPSFIADLHLLYWKRHNRLIDYLLLDYTFAIARAYIPAVHDLIERLPITEMGPLGKCLNEEYTPERWQEFCTRDDFHKVTYKIPLSRTTPEGKPTFYGHILDTFLPR